MLSIEKEFNTQIGYSDHTEGIDIAVSAVAMGAKIIEKHITLDRFSKGPDHLASIEPNDFKIMTKLIRRLELALGDGIKKPRSSELEIKSWLENQLLQGNKIGELFSIQI